MTLSSQAPRCLSFPSCPCPRVNTSLLSPGSPILRVPWGVGRCVPWPSCWGFLSHVLPSSDILSFAFFPPRFQGEVLPALQSRCLPAPAPSPQLAPLLSARSPGAPGRLRRLCAQREQGPGGSFSSASAWEGLEGRWGSGFDRSMFRMEPASWTSSILWSLRYLTP